MIYLDSSALVKLAHVETNSDALVAWLSGRAGTHMATSALARTETIRALRRSDPPALRRVPAVFDRLFVLPVNDPTLELAGAWEDPLLRTLDAIHLATARLLGAAGVTFVTYDKRLLTAARALGLDAVAPDA